MNIVWITSEAYPYAKTGGLADVASALPKAQSKKGHKVSVIMPYFPQVMKELTQKTEVVQGPLSVPFGFTEEKAALRKHEINDNLTFYFIEYNVFYDRPSLYDYNGVAFGDNAARFIFFSRAAMQTILALDINPDIIHTNDWMSALCNVYLKTPLYWNYKNFQGCRSVLTIHNIGYQGIFDKSNLFLTGLGWEYFNQSCLEYHDQLNFLKAGILTADMVNTVSPTYATEILSPEYGFTLDPPLHHVEYRQKLRGILNGIDTDDWNPQKDKLIPANFSPEDKSGKKKCKEALQREFSLQTKPDIPLIGLVSRLATQKGIDVLTSALERIFFEEQNIQVAILGTGDPELEGRLSYLNGQFPDNFSVFLGYNNKLAHLIEAGSDFFIMPSRYEPCGLNQMYSMRYGTIPIVRATGGLDDTVINYNPDKIDESTGFKFYELNVDAVVNTIRWAVYTYHNEKEDFKQMIHNGMTADFSWEKTASEYEQMYKDAFN
ncbi:MAG: glycogen synthase GlgA [Victivallales bacterium]|nr:glycogen synthase GlgA [Victivallales bacterium]MCF7888994.1 glycogen synthase GlgA [Victivallales bacterium]